MSNSSGTGAEHQPQELKAKEKESVDKALKGLLGWVEKRKTQAKTASGTSSKSWGWVVGLLVAVVVFIGLAIVAFWAWRKGREVAKLKHQIDVDKEKKEQVKVDLKLAKSENERKRLEAKEKELEHRIELRIQDIVELEAARKKAHAKIDAVTTWEDLDNL
jgi:uncharacterized protein HemX